MTIIKLGIHGGGGRLGRRIVALGLADPRFHITSVIVRPGSADIGRDIGTLVGGAVLGELTTDDPEALLRCDVVIDVSRPDAAVGVAALLAAHGGPPLVTGTTGWSDQQNQDLRAASQTIALLRSGNFSVGITALCNEVRHCAARLGRQWGVHIHDAHHSAKKDAPSGTALMLADAVCAGWGKIVKPKVLPIGMPLEDLPEPGDLVISVTREGDIIGTHNVHFTGPSETVSLSHVARSRDIFALGALQAAGWVSDKPAGLYDMGDILA